VRNKQPANTVTPNHYGESWLDFFTLRKRLSIKLPRGKSLRLSQWLSNLNRLITLTKGTLDRHRGSDAFTSIDRLIIFAMWEMSTICPIIEYNKVSVNNAEKTR
jgi:hypothetical protein